MKYPIMFLSTVLIASNVVGQSSRQSIAGYKIGDTIENILFNNLINSEKLWTQTADFKEKLLIINFWEAGCVNCVAALPKLDSLQKKYRDKIAVITVTKTSSKEEILKRLQLPIFKSKFSLPIALHDSVLHKAFPFQYVSHVVWILGGVVKAVTGSSYLKSENIDTILSNTEIDWSMKIDRINFDYHKSIFGFLESTYNPPKEIFYSAFSTCLNGVDPRTSNSIDSFKNKRRFYAINKSIFELCFLSAGIKGTPITLRNKNVIFEVKTPSKYIYKEYLPGYLNSEQQQYYEEWIMENTYCYEAVFPATMSFKKVMDKLKVDIDNYFGVKLSKAVREVSCAIIKDGSNFHGSVKEQGLSSNNHGTLVKIRSVEKLVSVLNSDAFHLPFKFVNESSKKELNLYINPSTLNLETLKSILTSHDLILSVEKRKVQMYIFRDDKFNSQTDKPFIY